MQRKIWPCAHLHDLARILQARLGACFTQPQRFAEEHRFLRPPLTSPATHRRHVNFRCIVARSEDAVNLFSRLLCIQPVRPLPDGQKFSEGERRSWCYPEPLLSAKGLSAWSRSRAIRALARVSPREKIMRRLLPMTTLSRAVQTQSLLFA